MSELINNREKRIEELKGIIRHLHAGAPADEVRGQLREIVRETDATEIAAMEQSLIADGMPVEEVRAMCDLHSQVLRGADRGRDRGGGDRDGGGARRRPRPRRRARSGLPPRAARGRESPLTEARDLSERRPAFRAMIRARRFR